MKLVLLLFDKNGGVAIWYKVLCHEYELNDSTVFSEYINQLNFKCNVLNFLEIFESFTSQNPWSYEKLFLCYL